MMATLAEALNDEQRKTITDSIREELLAFPGITKSMMHSRLTVKRGREWATVLDELLESGDVRMESKFVQKRAVSVFFWNEDDTQV